MMYSFPSLPFLLQSPHYWVMDGWHGCALPARESPRAGPGHRGWLAPALHPRDVAAAVSATAQGQLHPGSPQDVPWAALWEPRMCLCHADSRLAPSGTCHKATRPLWMSCSKPGLSSSQPGTASSTCPAKSLC